jgi:hypothetical protein
MIIIFQFRDFINNLILIKNTVNLNLIKLEHKI